MTPNRFRFRAWNPLVGMALCGVSRGGKVSWPCYPAQLGDEGELDNSGTILMQSTGLVDAKGVEVFEGDIVEGETATGVLFRAEVRWNTHGACWCFENKKSWSDSININEMVYGFSFTIIGNIHQHPHLLRG